MGSIVHPKDLLVVPYFLCVLNPNRKSLERIFVYSSKKKT